MAWFLSVALLIIILLNLAAAYAMNQWNRSIFDALEKKEAATVLNLSLVYFAILAISVAFAVAQVYARMTLQRRWRQWLTDILVDRWLKSGRYYQLNLVSGDHKNPEYRIADDVRIATESPVDFVSGVTSAFLSAATFIVVLWTIGGALSITIGGTALYIPGFLVIAAVLYAVIASGAMMRIGRRFVTVSEEKNQSEAELRYVLTRLRENGESIALIQGEQEERAGVDRALGKVLRAWRSICTQYMKTTVVSSSSGFIAPVLPIILCAPKYLDGSMSLGQVMQAASAFTIVQGAFNWLVDNYPRLADWSASARRAASLMVSLDGLERAESGDGFGRIKRTNDGDKAALRLKDLSVTLDDGTAVLDDTDIAIMPGERVLIAGESGTGKSTLVRAISGPVAVGRRPDRGEEGRQADAAAAAALHSDRHAAPRRDLSGRRRQPRDQGGRRGVQARRAGAPHRPHRGGRAVGPDAVGRREAAAGVRAHLPAQPGHHRARRGDRRARSGEPGQADGAA